MGIYSLRRRQAHENVAIDGRSGRDDRHPVAAATKLGMVDFRKSQPAGQLEKYAQVTGDIDAIHFVGRVAPIPLLLQFANYERYFDKISMQH
jgi:hypothetical protein